jgi:hypothetical protein
LISKSVGKDLLERSFVISHWSLVNEVSKVSMVSKLRRLKASIPLLYTNSNELSIIRHFDVFTSCAIHLKKPSGGPKGLLVPHAMGLFSFFNQLSRDSDVDSIGSDAFVNQCSCADNCSLTDADAVQDSS